MKKIVALLLALVILSSLTMTALAAGEKSGTTTITAEVPGESYTIHIPADMTLEYGNTEIQEIGTFYVSDVKNLEAGHRITCDLTVGALSDGVHSIPVTYYTKADGSADDNYKDWHKETLDSLQTNYFITAGGTINIIWHIGAQISDSDWQAAEPGTYTATFTFSFK